MAFRELIKELRALRGRERRRHETCLARIAEAQRSHNEPLGGPFGLGLQVWQGVSPIVRLYISLYDRTIGYPT